MNTSPSQRAPGATLGGGTDLTAELRVVCQRLALAAARQAAAATTGAEVDEVRRALLAARGTLGRVLGGGAQRGGV